MTMTKAARRSACAPKYRHWTNWLPGTGVVYDGRWIDKILGPVGNQTVPHVALGIVLSNDKKHIRVLWGSGCTRQFCMYEINLLNSRVMKSLKKNNCLA